MIARAILRVVDGGMIAFRMAPALRAILSAFDARRRGSRSAFMTLLDPGSKILHGDALIREAVRQMRAA